MINDDTHQRATPLHYHATVKIRLLSPPCLSLVIKEAYPHFVWLWTLDMGLATVSRYCTLMARRLR